MDNLLENFRLPKIGRSTGKRLRHCKIIGTLGPASSSEEVLEKLFDSGLNIVRLNFSHGDHAFHQKTIGLIRQIAARSGFNVAILQDLQGPKIRCGKLLGDKQVIKAGEIYQLEFGTEQSDSKIIPIDHRDLVKDVAVGQRVMMDDGLLIFKITEISGSSVHVKTIEGGVLKNRKGVNFPDSILSIPALTEKDSRDLLFGVANGVDFVALSFVQNPEDVANVKSMIAALGSDVPVVAKIEKLSAIEKIDEIAKVCDGLMVARGDLGVEASVEKVPAFQKKIIAAAHKHAKPVIIATQMLESMIVNPRATLAEVADVANGVLDGADCLMLSGEVAAGKYPVECVEKMSSVIENVEGWTSRHQGTGVDEQRFKFGEWPVNEAIAKSACDAVESLGAKAIVCLSLTGNIARSIAQWRPSAPIVAISPRRDVIQRLIIQWGVYGIQNPLFYNTDKLLHNIPELTKDLGIVNSGDLIVITAGIPINKMCATNMVKINRIP